MMKYSRQLKLLIVCIAFAVISVAFSVPVYADNIQDTVYIEYTLPNGFKYQLKPSVIDKRDIDDRNDDNEAILEYVFLIPKAAEDSELTLYPSTATLKDVSMKHNKGVIDEGTYTLTAYGEEYTVVIAYGSDIPQIYIGIEDGAIEFVHENKDNKAEGNIVVTDGRTIEYDGKLEYIKGRGNATWSLPQKPYNIKLAAKSNLFGMGAAKKYSLLANFDDYTCIRNKIAYDFADEVGIPYTSDIQMADLYLNNVYFGNYAITESVEIDKNRVNIFDIDVLNETFNPETDFKNLNLEGVTGEDSWETISSYKWYDLPNEAAAQINGGYLLELEFGGRYKLDEGPGFVSAYGQPVVIKSPEYASQKQVEYIMDYYQQFEDALFNDSGYNRYGKHYSEYIDIESFAKMYVFQEYVQNLDAGISSSFMYKDLDGKLEAGPVWDLDNSISSVWWRNGKALSNPKNIWVADGWRFASLDGRTLFALLWTHADFRDEAAKQWKEYFEPNIDKIHEELKRQAELTEDSVKINQYIWKNPRNYSDIKSIEEKYYGQIEEMKKYILDRSDFMSEFLSEKNSYIIYARNGGGGITLDPASYSEGDEAVVLESEYSYDGVQFLGWNTSNDGSGDWYMPGDILKMPGENVVLYAQWEGMGAAEVYQKREETSISLMQMVISKIESLFYN